MSKKIIKEPNEVINELLQIIEEKDRTIKGYKDINDNNKIIINGYKETVKTLTKAIKTKDTLIDSLLENSDSQSDTTQVLLNRIEKLNDHIENIRKIRPN